MVGKELCHGGNETTTNAERDTPNSLSSFHSTKIPFDTKVFASKLLKKFRAFSSPLSPSLRFLSNHRSVPFLSTAPAWLVSSTSLFFLMRKTNKTSQFLTSLPGFANCSHLEGRIWRSLKCPDGSWSKGSRVDFDRSRLTCQKCPYTKTS